MVIWRGLNPAGTANHLLNIRMENSMLETIAAILVVLWLLGIVSSYTMGGFSYTKDAHDADLGGMHLTLDERQRVDIPMWTSLGSLLGAVLLIATCGGGPR